MVCLLVIHYFLTYLKCVWRISFWHVSFFFFFGWLQIIVEDMSDENLIQSDNDNMMDNLNTEDDEFQ